MFYVFSVLDNSKVLISSEVLLFFSYFLFFISIVYDGLHEGVVKFFVCGNH